MLNQSCGRRGFTAALAAAVGLPRAVRAQAWPQRPLPLIVPYPPGGSTDIVDNRPGANGTLGVAALIRPAPDDCTLALVIAAHATNPSLYPWLWAENRA